MCQSPKTALEADPSPVKEVPRLVLPAELPLHLAKMDTGNGLWLIAVANVMETQSGQNLLLKLILEPLRLENTPPAARWCLRQQGIDELRQVWRQAMDDKTPGVPVNEVRWPVSNASTRL